MFGEASGLRINYTKSSAIVTRGDHCDRDEERIAPILQRSIGAFPCKYLGLQLAILSLTKAEWQPTLDSIRACAPAWQRGLINRAGRLVLVDSVPSARPTHHLLISEAPKWAILQLEKWLRAFFWAGTEVVQGGKCLVSWKNDCKPKKLWWLGHPRFGASRHSSSCQMGMVQTH